MTLTWKKLWQTEPMCVTWKMESKKHYHWQKREQQLLKYPEQAIRPALDGKVGLKLLTTVWRESWIYQVLPFIDSRDTSPVGNKVSDWKFFWSADHDFYTILRIWNHKSVWSTDKFVRKLILQCKNESSLKKITEGFFFKRVKIE